MTESQCSICKKQFTSATLQKYGGSKCGRCSKKEPTPIPASTFMDIITNGIRNLSQGWSISSNPVPEPPIKLTKQKIPQALRMNVWKTWGSKDLMVAQCYVCWKDITVDGFQAAHVVAESLGGLATIDNLRPTCSTCNQSMGTQNLFEFARENHTPGLTRPIPVLVSELAKRMPRNWHRPTIMTLIRVTVILKDVSDPERFCKVIYYLTWMLFEISEKQPRHVKELFLTLDISTPTSETNIAILINKIINIKELAWETTLCNCPQLIDEDVNFYDVYFRDFDDHTC
jgi:hypothetical protein